MQNNQLCKQHLDKQLQFICLDQTCNKQAKACVFCVRDSHDDCDENFIINVNQIQDKIVIKQSEDVSNLEQDVSKCIEKEFEEFFDLLQKEKDYILQGFQSPNNNTLNLTVEEVQKYKQFFDIQQNPKNKKVVIQNKINPKQENLQEDIEQFKAKLRNKMEVGSRLIEDIQFYNTYPLSQDSFETINCQLNKKYNGLEISAEKSKMGLMYSKKPVKNFKIKVTATEDEIPTIILVDQRELKSIKKFKTIRTFKNAFGLSRGVAQTMEGSNNYSYDFFEQYKFTTQKDDDDIFKNHNVKDDFINIEMICEFSSSQKQLKIYTTNKKTNLKNMKQISGKQYLVIGYFSNKNNILIEALNPFN